jgi:hypothetical protein
MGEGTVRLPGHLMGGYLMLEKKVREKRNEWWSSTQFQAEASTRIYQLSTRALIVRLRNPIITQICPLPSPVQSTLQAFPMLTYCTIALGSCAAQHLCIAGCKSASAQTYEPRLFCDMTRMQATGIGGLPQPCVNKAVLRAANSSVAAMNHMTRGGGPTTLFSGVYPSMRG